jgi:hypothetical protein
MNELANEPLDEKLSEFFKSEFPKPFPAAPRVIMPARMARGASPCRLHADSCMPGNLLA